MAASMRRTATVTTVDSILREYFLPAIQTELSGVRHPCDRPYEISFLGDGDGAILRWKREHSAWEAMLVATCYPCHGTRHSDTVFNYGRVVIPTDSMRVSPKAFMAALANELRLVTRDLRAHLERIYWQNARWPFRAEAVKRGCNCKWWGDAAIVEFNGECPIFHEHRRPVAA